jgi:predicted DNA-binding transcriptional regulator AlpA
MTTHQESSHYLSAAQVQTRVRLSRTTIDRLERKGLFPRRRRVSARAVRWLASEIESWITDAGTGEVPRSDADV